MGIRAMRASVPVRNRVRHDAIDFDMFRRFSESSANFSGCELALVVRNSLWKIDLRQFWVFWRSNREFGRIGLDVPGEYDMIVAIVSSD